MCRTPIAVPAKYQVSKIWQNYSFLERKKEIFGQNQIFLASDRKIMAGSGIARQ